MELGAGESLIRVGLGGVGVGVEVGVGVGEGAGGEAPLIKACLKGAPPTDFPHFFLI